MEPIPPKKKKKKRLQQSQQQQEQTQQHLQYGDRTPPSKRVKCSHPDQQGQEDYSGKRFILGCQSLYRAQLSVTNSYDIRQSLSMIAPFNQLSHGLHQLVAVTSCLLTVPTTLGEGVSLISVFLSKTHLDVTRVKNCCFISCNFIICSAEEVELEPKG